jgi:hypothetical protein
MHYCFFVVVAMQSEKSRRLGIESIAGEIEILDPYLAFWTVQSANLGGN